MSAKSEQAKTKRKEYTKEWHRRFREEHGMTYQQAHSLKKAMQMINTVTERNKEND